jgi:hypothetical protein
VGALLAVREPAGVARAGGALAGALTTIAGRSGGCPGGLTAGPRYLYEISGPGPEKLC